MTTLSVLLADDDPRLRADFRTVLELEDDLRVVGEAGDGAEAVRMAAELRPDVVVMDIRMPQLDGIAATRAIRRSTGHRCEVLVVTTFDLDEYVLAAVRAGAGGFLLKDRTVDELAEAVRTVARGESVVSPRATRRLLRELAEPAPAGRSPLSPRELEIVRLVGRGLSNTEIAGAAHVTVGTVKTHISSILTKLDLTNRVQIVLWAHEHGLLEEQAFRPAGPASGRPS